jgi:hypothetical protein
MKNFPKAFAALAALSFVGTSAFAQLTVNGTIAAASCALGVTTSATGTPTTSATLGLPNLATTTLTAQTAAGPILGAGVLTTFFVKPTSATCTSPGTAGTFNIYFSSANLDTIATTKAANVATLATRASNVVIDLVPYTATTTAPIGTGMDITKTTGLTQHGMPAQPLSTGSFQFNARYYKTSAAATTGSGVSATYVLNNEYQ